AAPATAGWRKPCQSLFASIRPPDRLKTELKRFPLEMNRDDKMLAVYPPHPEEGASTCASEKCNRRVAPVSKDAAAHRSRVSPRSASMRASRVTPTCTLVAPRTQLRIWVGQRSRLLTMR